MEPAAALAIRASASFLVPQKCWTLNMVARPANGKKVSSKSGVIFTFCGHVARHTLVSYFLYVYVVVVRVHERCVTNQNCTPAAPCAQATLF